jgi:hypothetical protein
VLQGFKKKLAGGSKIHTDIDENLLNFLSEGVVGDSEN